MPTTTLRTTVTVMATEEDITVKTDMATSAKGIRTMEVMESALAVLDSTPTSVSHTVAMVILTKEDSAHKDLATTVDREVIHHAHPTTSHVVSDMKTTNVHHSATNIQHTYTTTVAETRVDTAKEVDITVRTADTTTRKVMASSVAVATTSVRTTTAKADIALMEVIVVEDMTPTLNIA
jgi:hypothetical protein